MIESDTKVRTAHKCTAKRIGAIRHDGALSADILVSKTIS